MWLVSHDMGRQFTWRRAPCTSPVLAASIFFWCGEDLGAAEGSRSASKGDVRGIAIAEGVSLLRVVVAGVGVGLVVVGGGVGPSVLFSLVSVVWGSR